MSIGGVTFPLEQQSKDPQSVVYTGQYDTEGVAHTKSGERQPVQINIQVPIYTEQRLLIFRSDFIVCSHSLVEVFLQ